MQETMEEVEKRLGSSVVRYVKDLDMREVSKLTPQAQNVFSLMLAEWGKKKTSTISLPLTPLKNILGLSQQTDSYVDTQVKKLNRAIVKATSLEYEDENESFVAVLVPYIKLNKKERVIEATCLPQFLDVFIKLNQGYTQYKTAMFLRCRSKYAKNLFRIFATNFKGKCTLSMEELRMEMGAPAKSRNPDIVRLVDRAVKELRQSGIYEYVDYSPNVDSGRRGRPVVSISFKFEMSKEQIAELQGQERLHDIEGEAGAHPAQAADQDDPFPVSIEPSDMTQQPTAEEVEAALAEIQPAAKKKSEKKKSAPACPRCGKPMIIRKNGYGEKFWGCPDFPKCRGSLDYNEEE